MRHRHHHRHHRRHHHREREREASFCLSFIHKQQTMQTFVFWHNTESES